jgi:gamma-glutamyltranspeptidase/glutathione hydrolase
MKDQSPHISMTPGADQTGGMRNAGSPTPAVFPPPPSMRPTIVGRDFVVSAGHPTVAQIMAEILAAGGTAIDAGVAGGIASNVVQVDMCNLGGVAPTMIRPAGHREVWAIDGVGPWSHTVTLEGFLARHEGEMPLGAPVGVVPAAFDAWCTALDRFGTMRLADVMAPAIDQAHGGMVLDAVTATALRILGKSFDNYPSSRAIYWPEGRPPRDGERLVQSDLAATLQALADCDRGDRSSGIAAARALFYEGEIAETAIAFHKAEGGWLTREDLATYRSLPYHAPSVRFRGWDVATPGIVGQGPVMLQALGILEGFDLEALAHGSADALHLIAEALKQGFAERERWYADPAFAERPVDDLLAADHLAYLRGKVDPARAAIGAGAAPNAGTGRFDTTYVAAADAAGNLFSSMPSDTIDGGPVIPGLGFMISPRGVQSRIDPDHPAVLAPGKRPRLTPAPAIATNPTTGEGLAFGCPGGDMIVQAMCQSLVDMLVWGLTPQQAVEAPRVATFSHPGSFYPHPTFPRRLAVESRVPVDVRADLEGRGHVIHDWPDYEFDAGGVQIAGSRVLSVGGTPVLVAAADPRRCSYAAGR